jgi:hypothetical protein
LRQKYISRTFSFFFFLKLSLLIYSQIWLSFPRDDQIVLGFFSQDFCGRELGGVTCKPWIGVPLFSLLQILLCGQELGWWLGIKIIVLFLSCNFCCERGC